MSDRSERRGPSELELTRHAPEEHPLGRLLRDDFQEQSVPRLWRGIERRREHASIRSWRRVGLLAAAVSLAIALFAWLPSSVSPDALELAAGGMPIVLAGDRAPAEVALSDGSRIALSAGSRVEVLRNDGRSFVTVLRRGEGLFEVEPGGPRRWVVETGLASVEVVGTRFRVKRAADAVHVNVAHGFVLVRSETLPGGSKRLGAGDALEIRAPGAVPDRELPPAKVAPAAPPPPSAPVPSQEPAARAASPQGSGSSADDLDARLAAADRARTSGDLTAAAAELEAVVARAPGGDPRRGLAALSLARLVLASDPARAARALDRSLGSMPAALFEDALARLVEAEGRSGRRDRAERRAAEYLERFPDGRRAEDVKRWRAP